MLSARGPSERTVPALRLFPGVCMLMQAASPPLHAPRGVEKALMSDSSRSLSSRAGAAGAARACGSFAHPAVY